MEHLHKYLRDENNAPYAVIMIVRLDDGSLKFGWSKCNRDKGDKFEKAKGVTIAYGRATNPRTWADDVIFPDIQRWKQYAIKRLTPRA
jgi:hypothetical protein